MDESAKTMHEAITCIVNAVKYETDRAFAVYLQTCRALDPTYSLSDLVSALPSSASSHLERAGMKSFSSRALSEMRTAARAWGVSALLLLTVFSQAPRSDHFWRRLSLLARRGRPENEAWTTALARLDAVRSRRQNGLLARRKGLSRSQPWTLADVEAVLKEERSDQNNSTVWEAPPGLQGPAGNRFKNCVVFPIAVGWWTTRDAMRQLCLLLALAGPDFLAMQVPPSPSMQQTTVVLASRATLAMPIQVRVPQQHWVLGVVSCSAADRPILELFDPMSCHPGPASEEAVSAAQYLTTRVWPDAQTPKILSTGQTCTHSQQTGMNSGTAVLAAILGILCSCKGHPCPAFFDMDAWLWRRLFTRFFAVALEDDLEVGAATFMSAEHAVMLSADGVDLDALGTDVAEARRIWEAAEAAAQRSENNVVLSAIKAILDDVDKLTALLNRTAT